MPSSKSSSSSLTESQLRFHELTKQLRKKWKPHLDQKIVGKAILNDGYTSVFLQCGRKWGKTEIAIDLLWHFAYWFPGVPCYYIGPYAKQAKEILWADPRLQTFGPRKWLLDGNKGINNSELRLNFKNGSFIKVDGSDNFDAYRGVKFKLCIYDEYKDHRPEFRKAMRPNAAVLDGVELFMGSPPDRECDYTLLAKEHKEDPKKYFYRAPTNHNPFIAKEWLDAEEERLILRGEEDEWQREYMAEFVPGGITKIFGMLDRDKHVFKHADILREIARDQKKLHWYVTADPAAATVFAVIFMALNPYTKVWYVLDELYESDQSKMSVNQMGLKIISKLDELNDRYEWTKTYDEAEKWFSSEMMDRFQDFWQPTHKSTNKKEHGISLIKDTLLQGKLRISNRCEKLFWEMDNLYKDKQGKIPKKDDHLVDCLRYTLHAAYYSVKPEKEYLESKDESFRSARISDDFRSLDEMGEPKDLFDIDDESELWISD